MNALTNLCKTRIAVATIRISAASPRREGCRLGRDYQRKWAKALFASAIR